MKEKWKPITCRPAGTYYQVSNLGHVRNLAHILKPFWVSNNGLRQGALCVNLGKFKRAKVSHLVLEEFVGPRPPGCIALHWDDDPTNNRATNLRWGTYSDNSRDAVRNGRHGQAKRDTCSEGHEFDAMRSNGKRYCKTCARKRSRENKRRHRDGTVRAVGRPRKA